MRAACTLAYDGRECRVIRDRLDAFFDSTKTPILNIYSKCYGVGGGTRRKLFQSGRVRMVTGDMDCDDQLGAMNFFNNPVHQSLLHISPLASTKW